MTIIIREGFSHSILISNFFDDEQSDNEKCCGNNDEDEDNVDVSSNASEESSSSSDDLELECSDEEESDCESNCSELMRIQNHEKEKGCLPWSILNRVNFQPCSHLENCCGCSSVCRI